MAYHWGPVPRLLYDCFGVEVIPGGSWGGLWTTKGEYPHRVRYLNNFSRRSSTGRGVVDGTWWALRRYYSP